MSAVIAVLFALAIAHFITATLISLGLMAGAFRASMLRWQRTRRLQGPESTPSPLTLPLSAVVPAFNEEDAVVDSVWSILASGIPDLEVIVVDDGSSDDTVLRLSTAFEMTAVAPTHREPLPSNALEELLRSTTHPNVWLIVKQNGGKSDAINAGVNLASYRYVLLTDADSIFEPGALLATLNAIGFDAGRHVGAGGVVRVRNGMTVVDGSLAERRLPRSLLELFQVVEYMGAITGSRAGWNWFNGVPVLSGAFSIWRRDVLIDLGGMTSETTHEDLEFTFRVHEHYRRTKQPYQITALVDAIVWTEAPHRWRDLYAQRKRWQRVVYECMWRYRRMTGNPRYGEVGTVMMPYMLVFEFLGPLFEVVAVLLVILLAVWGDLSLLHLVLFLAMSSALVALTRILAIALDATLYNRFSPRDIISLSLVALLELFLYRPVITIARIMAFPEFLSGRRTWERVQRQQKETLHA